MKMKKNSFVEGTVFAYIAILLTKIMGAVYVIPFYKIIGTSGGALYAYAYNLYSLFLNIATSGVPTAVAIIVSEYNALKLFNEREQTYKVANKLLFVLSLVTFLVMFVFAKYLALFLIGDLKGGNSIESVTLVIRVISLCLLIVPFLSSIRGYLQGNKYINASSNSQVIEQFVRILVLLIGSYTAINLLNLSVSIGVSVALFGTVVGAGVAYIYLRRKVSVNKEELLKDVTDKEVSISNKDLAKKILLVALPIIVIAITQNIYEIIDLKFIIMGLNMIGFSASDCELISSIIVTWTPKICMIINALALGLCTSIVPFIVEDFTHKKYESVNKKFNQAINTILFVAVPLSLYIITFSSSIYYVFYGKSLYGGNVLATMSVVSITFSISLVINMILQGIKKPNIVYKNTVIGLIVNACLDLPLILLFNKVGIIPYLGSLVATFIGQLTSITLVMMALKKEYGFEYKGIFKTFSKMLLPLFIYIIVLIGMKLVVPDTYNYLLNIVKLGICGIISVGIYLLVALKNNSLEYILGDNVINKVKSKIFRKKD